MGLPESKLAATPFPESPVLSRWKIPHAQGIAPNGSDSGSFGHSQGGTRRSPTGRGWIPGMRTRLPGRLVRALSAVPPTPRICAETPQAIREAENSHGQGWFGSAQNEVRPGLDDFRIPPSFDGFFPEKSKSIVRRERMPIGTHRRESVVDVHDADNPHQERELRHG